MNERRVRSSGRQVYGRNQPLKRPVGPRIRRPALSGFQQRLLVLVIFVGLVVYGLSQLFAVTKITISSPGRGEEIKAEVQKILDVSWRQRNLLTLDDGELVSDLQQADPLIRSVEVRRRWVHGIAVKIVLKQPSLGWSTGNQKFLLDRDGTAIGRLPAGSTLAVVNDGSNLPVEIGQRVASARFVSFASDVVPALSAIGVVTTALSVKETTLDLTVSTNKGYQVIFDTGRSVGEEIADLKSVQALLATQKKTPSAYIDLRIGGKAYYK